MAYNSSKGPQTHGDVQYEGDPSETQIDFENDFIALKTSGSQVLVVSGSRVGIGMSTPGIHPDGKNDLVIGNQTGHRGVTIASGPTSISTVRFTYPTNANNGEGWIDYSNNSKKMRIGTNGLNTRVTVSADGTDIVGRLSASLGVSGSTLNTATTTIGTTYISSSLAVSASSFWVNGAPLVGGMSSWTLSADGGSNQTIENGNTVDIAGGTGITTAASATDTVTVNLDNTSVSAGSYTYSAITVDAQGRLTAASSGTGPAVTTYNNATDNYILTSAGAGSINGEANLTFDGSTLTVVATSSLNGPVTINDAGEDQDFRVETVDESHMLFVEGSSNRMSIGDNTGSPGATLEIKNHASAGATGVPLLQLNNNDTDQQCLDINAGNVDANVVNVTANDVTTARVLAIGADGLTTGNALYVDDNSPNTGTRNTALIIQNHTGAINTQALAVQSDGGKTGVKLDKNYSDTAEASVVGLDIDWDKTGASTTDNTMYGIQLDMDNTTATNGTNTMYGLQVTPTLTHAADAGTPKVKGAVITATGGTNGTSTATGMELTATGADTNEGLIINCADGGTDLKIVSSADTGDFFQIQTTTHGATTITTVDDDATAAHLIFTVDGDITLDPAGEDVIVDGNLSASINISASAFYGDGTTLSGVGAGTMSSWTLSADAGSSQAITDGNTVDIAGGTGISTAASATDTVTVNLDNTSVSAGSYTYTAITVDAQGRLTAAANGTAPSITTLNSAGANRVLTSDGGASATAETGLTYNGSILAAVGEVSASLGLTGSSIETAATMINPTHVSSSLNISGSALYVDVPGILEIHKSDGGHAQLRTNTAHLQLRNKATNKDIRLQLGEDAGATGVKVRNNSGTEVASVDSQGDAVFRHVTASLGITGSSLHTNATVINATHISSSLNVSASSFYAKGVELVAPAVATYTNSGDNRIITSVNSSTINAEDRLTFNGSTNFLFLSGNAQIRNHLPYIFFSNSSGTGLGYMGYNSANNILIQNNTSNQHIVFKANDGGSIKEGLRLDGAVPEVVVNQTSESLVNFRVESDSNEHMLYVQGSTNRVGINTSAPEHTLSVSGTMQVSGSFRAKVLEVTRHTYQYGSTSEHYVPFVGTGDATNADWENQMVAPFNGNLKRVYVRPQNTQNGNITGSLWIATDTVAEIDSGTRIEVVTASNNANYTTTTLEFTGSNHFAAGDIVGFSINPRLNPGKINLVCIWEYDQTGF